MKPFPGRSYSTALAFANRLIACAALISLPLVGTGCSDRSQQVEEQVTELQRQVQGLEAQLDAAKREANSLKDQQQTSTTSTSIEHTSSPSEIPSKEALETSFESATKKLREEVASKIGGMRIESCSTQSVQVHRDVYPFDSEVALSLRSSEGKAYQLAVPVKADCTGKWILPSADEIVAYVNASKNATPVSEQAAANAARSETSSNQPRPPIMAIDGTIKIQWPEERKPAGRRPAEQVSIRSTSSAPAAPAPTAPPAATPPPAQNRQPVMPVNRDVHIEFNR